jgi:hypothetical protein
MAKSKTYPELVAAEIKRARKGHAPIHSLHEGFAVLLEEVDEFKEEVWKKRSKRDQEKIKSELVQIGAMAQRVFEDVVLTQRAGNAG